MAVGSRRVLWQTASCEQAMPDQPGVTRVKDEVIGPQPNAMFTVELENGNRVLAHVAQ